MLAVRQSVQCRDLYPTATSSTPGVLSPSGSSHPTPRQDCLTSEWDVDKSCASDRRNRAKLSFPAWCSLAKCHTMLFDKRSRVENDPWRELRAFWTHAAS